MTEVFSEEQGICCNKKMEKGFEDLLKRIVERVMAHLKTQYSGGVDINVYYISSNRYQVVLRLEKSINFDALRRAVNKEGAPDYKIKPDCSQFGSGELGGVPFFLKIQNHD